MFLLLDNLSVLIGQSFACKGMKRGAGRTRPRLLTLTEVTYYLLYAQPITTEREREEEEEACSDTGRLLNT